MEDSKMIEQHHRELAESSPSAGSDASHHPTSDPEKTAAKGIERTTSHIHDDDNVTLKTWAIVVVG